MLSAHSIAAGREAVELGRFLVAAMSRGGAGNDWELLKRKENRRDKPRHERGPSPKAKPLNLLATPAGFEPATLSLEG